MYKEKSVACHEHRIITSSYSSDDNNNVSLGADQEEAYEAHVLTHDATSSSAVPQHRGGVLSQWDSFTHKYESQWKYDISM